MNPPLINRLEKLTAIALSLVIVVLLIVRAQRAGGLWRDECGLLQLSQMPSVADILANFPHEAFPPLFPSLIRAWTTLFGTTDVALRCFGVVVGALFIGVAWFNSRLFGNGVPLLSLALIGLNSTFLTWGTSIRGYGLASVIIALAFGLLARFLVRPTPVIGAATLLAFVASVQCLLHNTVLLLAIGLSAIIVLLRGRKFKLALAVLGFGLVSLLSFLPYVGPYASARAWDVTVRSPGSAAWLWHQLTSTFGMPMPFMAWIWAFCFVLLIGGAIWRLYAIPYGKCEVQRDLLLFAVLSSAVSLVSYLGFLHLIHYFPQPWYYFTILAIIGIALDVFAVSLSHIRTVGVIRLLFALALLVLLPFADWQKITERQTNMDMVAKTVAKNATRSDLIVVSPWQYGIPFNWYYGGETPWVTLPQVTEHRLHRYDLVKTKMTLTDPNVDLRDAIRNTLSSGNRVWFVGDIRVPLHDAKPLSLTPAPDPKYGWNGPAYFESWSEQMGVFLRAHVPLAQLVPVPTASTISDMENVPIVVAKGWRD